MIAFLVYNCLRIAGENRPTRTLSEPGVTSRITYDLAILRQRCSITTVLGSGGSDSDLRQGRYIHDAFHRYRQPTTPT